MENEKFETLGSEHIPPQHTGSEMDAVEKIDLANEAEAIRFFETVKDRLLNVNSWGEMAKLPMSSFRLVNSQGQEKPGKAQEGDYVKIDIPGPGTQSGKGFDWVILESIKENQDIASAYISITARPAPNPTGDVTEIAHFLKDDATSTFQVKRIGNTIYAEEHGRNEVPNTDTNKSLDNIRNTLVGWGAKLGLSYPQWKSLVKGLVSKPE